MIWNCLKNSFHSCGQICGQTHFWPLFFMQWYSVVWGIKAGKVQLWTGCFSSQMHAGNAISAFCLLNNDTVPEKQFFLKFGWNLFAQMQILEIVFIISQSFVFCKSEYKVLFSYLYVLKWCEPKKDEKSTSMWYSEFPTKYQTQRGAFSWQDSTRRPQPSSDN